MTLSPPLSKGLALGLLAALLAAVYLVVVDPLLVAYRDNETVLQVLRQRLAGYQRVAAQRPQLEQALESAGSEREQEDLFLRNSSRALAAAELQAYARETVEGAEASLVSTQPLTVEQGEEASSRVSVRVRMTGSIGALQAILHRLESGRPLILVEDVSVNRRPQRRRPGSPGAELDWQLDVRFTLTGFIRGGTGT
jgi:general secretion pathway protein M